MVIGAFFEVLGVGLFMPLLMQDEENKIYLLLKLIFDSADVTLNNLNIAVFIILIFLSKFIIITIQNYVIYKVSYDYMHKVKKNIIEQIFNMEYLSFLKLGIEKINNVVTKEVEKASFSIRYLLQFMVNTIYTLSYLCLALYINYNIVLVTLIIGSVIVYIQRTITRRIIYYSKEIVVGNDKTNLLTLQILNNFKYLLSTNSFKNIKNDYDETSRQYSNNSKKISFFNSIPKTVPELVGIIVISILIIINEIYFHENIVTVVFLGLLLYRLLTKVLGIQKSYQDFLINVGSIERLISLEKYSIENKNCVGNNELLINAISSIVLEKVYFKINKKIILENITYSFKKGKTTGIVGISGSGKTSLLNLIIMLYKHSNGKIRVNNMDSRNINIEEYKNDIGYVSQESIIFEDSVKNNIIFGKEFDEDKFCRIIKLLNIEDMVNEKLIMDGTNISGGQKQRISIARELYKNPQILILDESTSALDANIEKEIMGNLSSLKNDMIIIVVAHRLSTLVDIDEIMFLEQGRISDMGSMRKLYGNNEKFKIMCNNQNIFIK